MMWFKEDVVNPSAPGQTTYIKFGIGYNPRKKDKLDVLIPKKFRDSLRNTHAIGDSNTYKMLLQDIWQKYSEKWIPLAQRSQYKNYWSNI